MIESYLGALAIVLGLAAATFTCVRLARQRGILRVYGRRCINVIENRALGANASLILVEVDGQRLLLGTSRSGLLLIERFAAPPSAEIVPFDAPFSTILRRARK
jgi:flagellar biogenesis protein FliO